jgi:hypothetical protein
MSEPRLCPHCGASLRWLETDCPACGQSTGQPIPWYVYGLGGLIFILLLAVFGDIAGLGQFLANLVSLLHG